MSRYFSQYVLRVKTEVSLHQLNPKTSKWSSFVILP